MNREIKTKLGVLNAVASKAHTADATGSGIDLAEYDSAMFILNAGIRTDGVHTPKLQESDDDSTYTDVSSDDVLGAFVAVTSASVQKVGYIGSKRYARVFVTVSGTTTGAVYSASAVLGNPKAQPVA